MSLQLCPFGNQQFCDVNGNPAAGYQLFVYAGRTTTKQTTYTDLNGVGSQTNPIILNAQGFPSSPIFIDTALSYKFVLASPTDTDPPQAALYTVDQVTVGLSLPMTVTAEWIAGTTPSYISGTQFSVAGDQRLIYNVGRRVKILTNAGTLYGTISVVAFTTVTTVTVLLDAGSVDNTISGVFYGFLSASGSSWPSGLNIGLTTILSGELIIPLMSSFNLLQAGSIFPYAGMTTPPSGYLKCDGSAVSRTTYAALFAAIGTVFGPGDGTTTFNLPTIANIATGIGYLIRYA